MSQLSRQARDALELVRHVPEPSPTARLRGRQRLHAAIATGAVTSTAAVVEAATLARSAAVLPGASLLTSVVGPFAIGIAVGVGGIAGTEMTRLFKDGELPPREAAPAAQGSAAPSAPTVAVLTPPPVKPEPSRAAVAAPPRSALRSPLALETAYIEKAQLELQGGEVDAALSTLSAYFAEYPRGILAEEAKAAQIVALCGSGRQGDGRRRALEFERINPNSMLVPRVRQACGAE